ncbi:MAG: hypothetical protein COU10_02510 [Candidatus Harrisonbacteria bacterium CG10_big_fil_rev_8_21_14_0_10_45_28]|uniref:DUF5667 domain-containing protein n=1 Tax=Candidatus Harrisonbacteria bacterium CG10_big_fil_rev_8_21_14_0_10_45_28 TaxID=1974586 RepID=A0A2H0UN37_9BACT|nr:MAG: hypothetical protein COU10_02510 [Candidatus Harrisonbacteria bacterium CG10_big_fil_rev_8_21_14_0_10_45_28]
MFKTISQKLALFSAALLIGVLVFPVASNAQSEDLKNALDNVDKKVEKVEKVQTENIQPTEDSTAPTLMLVVPKAETTVGEPEVEVIKLTEKEQAGLTAKKEALLSILDFSVVEVEELVAKMDQVIKSTEDAKIKATAKSSIELLTTRLEHLKLTMKTLAGDISVEDVQALALELKAWRETIYNPEIKNILDIALVNQAEMILIKTKARMKKVSQDVTKIEARVEGNPLAPFFTKAGQDLEKATWYFLSARDQIVDVSALRNEILNPKEEVIAEGDVQEPVIEELPIVRQAEEADEPEVELTPLEENSLAIEDAHKVTQLYVNKISQHIKSIYSTFLEMSTEAKKILAQ